MNTINHHRFLVRSMCFKCGLIKQGLLHDLSKYSPSEFIPSVKYYQGYRSPITYEKEIKGYSECWLHHKGRNKHHWEFWTDRVGFELVCYEMPFNYVLESVLDKIAASKVYKKQDYNEGYPIKFFKNSYEYKTMNIENAKQIESLLNYLKENGEEQTLKHIKKLYKEWKVNNKKHPI